MQIGFIGTGTMTGTPIAGCLIDVGHRLTVFDIRPEATQALVGRGADSVDSPRAVAEHSEVVFTALPGPDQMEPAVLDPVTGILAGLRSGTCYIDLTTNAPTVARRVAEACHAKGVAMLDAPVSGRPPGMTVMIGGDNGSSPDIGRCSTRSPATSSMSAMPAPAASPSSSRSTWATPTLSPRSKAY